VLGACGLVAQSPADLVERPIAALPLEALPTVPVLLLEVLVVSCPRGLPTTVPVLLLEVLVPRCRYRSSAGAVGIGAGAARVRATRVIARGGAIGSTGKGSGGSLLGAGEVSFEDTWDTWDDAALVLALTTAFAPPDSMSVTDWFSSDSRDPADATSFGVRAEYLLAFITETARSSRALRKPAVTLVAGSVNV
jgi:hypothetical protein